MIKKCISVTSHALYPSPCHKLSHLLGPPPLEREVLYGRRLNPLRLSSIIVEGKRGLRIVMALKQRSEEQNVIGNVAALRNNFHTIHFTKRFGEFANASSIA